MSRIRNIAMIVSLACAACVQMPTEKSATVDLRPLLNFKLSGSSDGARVFVDGLEMGPLDAFLQGNGKAADGGLRVLSGMHQVRVVRGASVLVDERVYLGDGATKTIGIQ